MEQIQHLSDPMAEDDFSTLGIDLNAPEWKHELRRIDFLCPKCKAPAKSDCRNHNGSARVLMHPERKVR